MGTGTGEQGRARQARAGGLVGRTAVELAGMVREGTVSPTEVVSAHLERIAGLDGRVGAFQLVRAGAALAEARALERRGDLRALPLAGVPVAVKDNVRVAGEPTRYGTRATPQAPAGADDLAVRRLREAGCVVVGKTRLPELGIWHFTESASFGVTRNPWNLERSAGGSSGGSAAAVAAGMVPVALANDGLGSIRIPAAWCGLVGVKPGPGVVPVGAGDEEHWFGMTAWGPLATCVADAALLLDVMAGTTHLRAAAAGEPRPLRVALSTASPVPFAPAEREVQRGVEAAAAVLREAGHSIREADPPYTPALALPVLQRWFAGAAQDAERYGADWRLLERRTRGMIRLGRLLAGGVNPRHAERWRRRLEPFFARHDALLCPAVARPAPPVGAWEGRGWLRTCLGGTRYAPFAAAWNLAGFPAASVPVGISPAGLPLAVQVVAPAGQEARVLALAAQLERFRPWPRLASCA